MSSFARKFRRNARRFKKPSKPEPVERLFAVAVKRGDQIWDGGKGSHSKLRRNLDPNCADPYNTVPGDIDGFIVSPSGRFVDREEAKRIAENAGQCMAGMHRELLSSDLTW